MGKREIVPLDELIADNFKALRLERGVTQEKAAEMMGCSTGMITHLETAQRSWKTKWIYEAAKAFKIHPSELMGGAQVSKTDLKILDLMKKQANVLSQIEAEENKS